MELTFVNTTAENRKPSKEQRRLITSQTRKAAAATRRRRGDLRQVNTFQPPEFLLTQLSEEPYVPRLGHSSDVTRREHQIWRQASAEPEDDVFCNTTTTSLTSFRANDESFESVSLLLQPNIIDHLLQGAMQAECNADPRRWVKIYQLLNSPLVASLPQLVGVNACLDAAVDCLSLRVHCALLHPEKAHGSEKVAQRYDVAIRALARSMGQQAVDWTTWYASLLLTVFELLDQNSNRAWLTHSNGACRVLEYIGPHAMLNETNKDVFITQMELSTLEALSGHRTLPLDQAEWQSSIDSFTLSSANHPTRSEQAASMLKISARMPHLLSRTVQVILNSEIDLALLNDYSTILKDLNKWNDRHGQDMREKLQTVQSVKARHVALKSVTYFLALKAVVHRCVVALTIAQESEFEAISCANRGLKQLEDARITISTSPDLRYSALLLTSITQTSEEWMALDYGGPDPDPSLRRLFRRWCSLLGWRDVET